MERALCIPEILATIFQFGESLSYKGCLLVNRVFFHEAIRVLWKQCGQAEYRGQNRPGIYHLAVAAESSPARAQVYANCIFHLHRHTRAPSGYALDRCHWCGLKTLQFPQLVTLRLRDQDNHPGIKFRFKPSSYEAVSSFIKMKYAHSAIPNDLVDEVRIWKAQPDREWLCDVCWNDAGVLPRLRDIVVDACSEPGDTDMDMMSKEAAAEIIEIVTQPCRVYRLDPWFAGDLVKIAQKFSNLTRLEFPAYDCYEDRSFCVLGDKPWGHGVDDATIGRLASNLPTLQHFSFVACVGSEYRVTCRSFVSLGIHCRYLRSCVLAGYFDLELLLLVVQQRSTPLFPLVEFLGCEWEDLSLSPPDMLCVYDPYSSSEALLKMSPCLKRLCFWDVPSQSYTRLEMLVNDLIKEKQN